MGNGLDHRRSVFQPCRWLGVNLPCSLVECRKALPSSHLATSAVLYVHLALPLLVPLIVLFHEPISNTHSHPIPATYGVVTNSGFRFLSWVPWALCWAWAWLAVEPHWYLSVMSSTGMKRMARDGQHIRHVSLAKLYPGFKVQPKSHCLHEISNYSSQLLWVSDTVIPFSLFGTWVVCVLVFTSRLEFLWQQLLGRDSVSPHCAQCSSLHSKCSESIGFQQHN